MRFRAANRTILLVTGIAAFVQAAGSIGESVTDAAVAAAGIALAVFAGWLQLPVRSSTRRTDPDAPDPDAPGTDAPGTGSPVAAGASRAEPGSGPAPPDGTGTVGTADPPARAGEEPQLAGQIAITALLLALGYFAVFVAGLATTDFSAYLYESGARPATKSAGTSPGSGGSEWEWVLTPGARSVTTFRRADGGSRDAMLLLGEFFVPSCGALDWTLATDGGRQLSHGRLDPPGRQRFRIPLPDRDHSTTLHLTLARADSQDCTAVVGAAPLWAAARPRIPLPGLATYIETTI